jgi:hypothetical protein
VSRWSIAFSLDQSPSYDRPECNNDNLNPRIVGEENGDGGNDGKTDSKSIGAKFGCHRPNCLGNHSDRHNFQPVYPRRGLRIAGPMYPVGGKNHEEPGRQRKTEPGSDRSE